MWVVNTSALTGFTYKRIDWELCPSMISTDDLSKYKNNLWHYSLFSKTDGKRHLSMDVSSSLTVNHWEWNEAACSFKKSNTTGFPMLSYSQQSRPSIFPVKLTKRIKMLQVTFTKYTDRREKYILVCLWQQKPPPKSAAILLNWRSTRVLQKGFVVAGEWEEEEHLLPAPHFRFISCSEQIQPQRSPNSGNKRLAQQVLVGNIFPDTQMFRAGGTLLLGASIEATVETKEDSSHLNPPHNYLLSLTLVHIW